MADIRLTILAGLLYGVLSVSAECPETFERHGTQCYKIFTIKTSWLDGIRFCRLQGAQMLSIQTESEQHTIEGMITRIRGALTNGNFWTGGSDAFNEGVFSWFYEDGHKEPQTGYSKWSNQQPNNHGGYENCLGLYYSGREALWDDRECNEQRYPICETPSV